MTTFFENEKNVTDYINMVDKYAGKHLIEILQKYLPAHSTLLEIGMGPGYDLDLLQEHYDCTGSDKSPIFLDKYLKTHKNAKVIPLDATAIKIETCFDCIYSNKAMIHLTKSELAASLEQQKNILNKNGVLFHTFWLGNGSETIQGLFFQNYSHEELRTIYEKHYQIFSIESYTELDENDSCYVLCKRR